MTTSISSLLSYPFEKGLLDFPDNEGASLIWGSDIALDVIKNKASDYLQIFKPYADKLKAQGIDILNEEPSQQTYRTIFCALPKQKEAAKYQLAKSLWLLEENGLLIAVASNDTGGKRLKKWFEDFGLQADSISKSKCRIVWAHKKNIAPDIVDQAVQAGYETTIKLNDDSYITRPGIFGWNKIDLGSRLLLEALTDELKGVGADFGCGYGFLSCSILGDHSGIKKLYALDADYNALMCCQKNLAAYSEKIDYQWLDLTQHIEKMDPLDFIVMNPPFHEGRDTDAEIGQKFIQTASQRLKKRGVLYIVANVHLPYERTLQAQFADVEKVDERQGFKVFLAVK